MSRTSCHYVQIHNLQTLDISLQKTKYLKKLIAFLRLSKLQAHATHVKIIHVPHTDFLTIMKNRCNDILQLPYRINRIKSWLSEKGKMVILI